MKRDWPADTSSLALVDLVLERQLRRVERADYVDEQPARHQRAARLLDLRFNGRPQPDLRIGRGELRRFTLSGDQDSAERLNRAAGCGCPCDELKCS